MRDTAASVPAAAPADGLRERLFPFGRVLLRGWFRLFQRHRYDRLVLETVAGRSFVVLPRVFNPGLFASSTFLAGALDETLIPRGAHVLDMGTGSGVGAVFAAARADRVDAVDVNPEAVRCARLNVLLHRVEDRVTVWEGDLFAPLVGRRYDIVLFNPPFHRGVPRDVLDRAWRSVDVVERFAVALDAHLRPGGRAFVVLSTDGDAARFLAAFAVHGFVCDVVATRRRLNETLTLYRLSPRRNLP